MIIYKITNLVNNKIYIGQTINTLKYRWQCHLSSKNQNTVLKKAINKYGKDSFKIEQIDSASTIDELNEKEEYWIKELNSMVPFGYNMNSGGLNRIPSDLTRKKKSESAKKLKHTGSEYKGVKWSKQHNAWHVEIFLDNGKRKFVGLYEIKKDAAYAYDLGIILYRNGEGYLNFPDDIRYDAFEKKRKRTISPENQKKMNDVIRARNQNRGSYSKHKGVSFDKSKRNNPWIASLHVGKDRIFYKYFNTEQEAAVARNFAVLRYLEPGAYLNDVSLDDVINFCEKHGDVFS